jgi:hypothetical protein
MAYKMRCGKGYELAVLGLLTLADFDVYAPLVDDQGIDGIIRVQTERGVRFFDLQIKGSKRWDTIRCSVSALPPDSVLILFCDNCKELLWFLQPEAAQLFPPQNPKWGDIFLKAEMVKRFKEEGRGDLLRLREWLTEYVANTSAITVSL